MRGVDSGPEMYVTVDSGPEIYVTVDVVQSARPNIAPSSRPAQILPLNHWELLARSAWMKNRLGGAW